MLRREGHIVNQKTYYRKCTQRSGTLVAGDFSGTPRSAEFGGISCRQTRADYR
jgi:hypothetical protein